MIFSLGVAMVKGLPPFPLDLGPADFDVVLWLCFAAWAGMDLLGAFVDFCTMVAALDGGSTSGCFAMRSPSPWYPAGGSTPADKG